MAFLSIPKGLNLNIAGQPALEVVDCPAPATLALLPERIPFFKPRLLVAEGEQVRVGTPLVADKRNPQVILVSPAGGKVTAIRLGPRRVIREIVITRDTTEEFIESTPLTLEDLAHHGRTDLIARIITGGLWPLMRQFPFGDYARIDSIPPAIIVALDSQEPFQPDPRSYLKGREDLIEYGLTVLERMGAEQIHVTLAADRNNLARTLNGRSLLAYTGKYPAGESGVTLYHIKRSSTENRAWYIRGQDLLLWAQLLQSGRYPTERVVAVGGNLNGGRHHYRTRLGAPLAQLLRHTKIPDAQRFVVGGIFSGYRGTPDSHLGLLESSLTLLDEGHREEFLALFNPGLDKPTFSRVFASRLKNRPVTVDCNKHGGDRACIACMHCGDVCPVDILPQLAFKAIQVGEVEEYLAHGLLDCVECGLCSYVCPSKIELTATLKKAKAEYMAEYNWAPDGDRA